MIAEVWSSFRSLPVWVQIWVALILVPVNLWSLLYVGAPGGVWIAALAVGGMLPNLGIMAAERGLSKLMALPHLILWTPLVALILMMLGTVQDPAFQGYLVLLLIVDGISLAFDYPDFLKWLRGDRAIAK